MIEAIILGIIQGIFEWLPVSSEGMLVLAQTNLFGQESFVDAVTLALFLHLGTLFAAIVYFRKDVWRLLHNLFRYKHIEGVQKQELNFYIIATFISGALAFGLLSVIESSEEFFVASGKAINILIALALFVTAYLQLRKKNFGERTTNNFTFRDGVVLGLAQGLAAIPGISRSGTTIAALLMRKFTEKDALTTSFIMSIPIVLAGNIALNFNTVFLSAEGVLGLATAFVVGLATIHVLLTLSKRIPFGYFVLGFGVLLLVASIL